MPAWGAVRTTARLDGGHRNPVWRVAIGGTPDAGAANIRISPAGAGIIDWDEARIDASILNLAQLPVERLDGVSPEHLAEVRTALDAWEAANGWLIEPDYARRRLARLPTAGSAKRPGPNRLPLDRSIRCHGAMSPTDAAPASADERSTHRPCIGFFDSGVGGLAILAEVARLLPDHPLLYYADTAYFPYGGRSPEQVIARSIRITQFLIEQGAGLIVVACNTASTAALPALRQAFERPFVGVVPAVKPAAALSTGRRVAVLATEGTLRSAALRDLVQRFAPGVTVVPLPAPGLAGCVERGALDTPDTISLLDRCLAPARAAGVDTLILGCTHYRFVQPAIERMLGPDVAVVDCSAAVARQVTRLASRSEPIRREFDLEPLRYMTSGDPARFADTVWRLRAAGVDVPVASPPIQVSGPESTRPIPFATATGMSRG